MATVPVGGSIDDAMQDLCEKVASDVIPMQGDANWDYLRVEFWPDSGRIIAFPASTSTVHRIDKSGCQVIFEDLLARYEELADSDMSDEEFTKRLLAEERKWIDRFLAAARSSKLRGTRVMFYEADDEPPIQDVII